MNRRTLIALCAASAMTSGAAWAQPDKDQHDRGNGGGRGEQRGGGPQAAQPQPQAQRQGPPAPQGRPGGEGGFRGGQAAPAPRQAFQAPAPGGGGRAGGFVYRGQEHARIQGPYFSYPSGYSYRRWRIGQDLPFLFLVPTFFFLDWANYGFGPPPRGYVWVRYGPDLLLVSRRTGRIREVIYDVFY
jgi:Ni/Co efflux regulator RcnB